MSPKILSEKAIPLETVKDLLKNRSRIADLNYIQRITLDFGHRFSEEFPHSEELIEQMGQSFNLTREESIQIININPANENEISLILEDKLSAQDKTDLISLIESHKQEYKSESTEDLPTDISSSSFHDNDGKDDYPDEEPVSSDEE